MRFEQLHGNDQLVKALTGMVDSGRVPHAIMFSESDGGGAVPMALAFLQYLFCHERSQADSCGVCPSCNKIDKLIHPDLHMVFPTAGQDISAWHLDRFRSLVATNPCFTEHELNSALGIEGKNTTINVAEAKEILSALSLKALEGGYRALLIYLPEKMNKEASNRLLKAIEEPEEKTQFVLVTHAPELVLSTISSRCQRVHVISSGTAHKVEFDEPQLLSELMEALIAKDLLAALDVGAQIAALTSRESAKAFCKYAGEALRDMFLIRQGMPQLSSGSEEHATWASACKPTFPRAAIKYIDRAQMLIGRNVNLKIVFTDLVDRLFTII